MPIRIRLLVVVAGLMGAAGVATAAAGAHVSGGGFLPIAANFLMIHAAAVVALAAAAVAAGRRTFQVAAALLAVGAIVFSGDLVARELLEIRLLPNAAPTGGVLMILGWLATAVAAILARPR